MDHSVLRKRLNTFKDSEGRLREISDELIIEVLPAWENWQGTTAELYRELAVSKMQMAIIIKKAKKLVKSGVVLENEFHELPRTEASSASAMSMSPIEIALQNGNVVRFAQVDLLVDFLKKVS